MRSISVYNQIYVVAFLFPKIFGALGHFCPSVLKEQGQICNNSEFYTLISKRLSAENKAKLCELETPPP